MSDAQETRVVIVGGGPVGMGLAVDLALRGIESVVVEKHFEPSPIPKGQNLTGRTVEHFYFWGADEALRRAKTQPKGFGASGITAYGTLTSGYHYNWLSRHWVKPFYFQGNERVPQYGTERVLRERAASLPQIKTMFGWSATDVSQDEQGATVSIRQTQGGASGSIRGLYLVGCDGAWSTTREQCGITITRSDHDRRMVLLVFESRGLHELLAQRYPGVSFFNVLHPRHRGYWQFFGRVDVTTFFFHAPVAADTTLDNFDFKALLHQAADADFDIEIQHIGFWDLRIAQADAYQTGRILIAGDAAHSHPPYGGYGINTGFEDIRNLGWKLAATIYGWAGERLLASYHEERYPVFRSTADEFIDKAIHADRDFVAGYSPDTDLAAFEKHWQARSAGAQNEVDAFEPNYEGSSIVAGSSGKPSACGAHRDEARAGHHLTPLVLSDGRNIYQALGDGFTLLALDIDDAQVAAFEQAARNLGIPFFVVRDCKSGELLRYDADLILIRPDQFVAWSGYQTPKDGVEQLLRRVIGAVL